MLKNFFLKGCFSIKERKWGKRKLNIIMGSDHENKSPLKTSFSQSWSCWGDFLFSFDDFGVGSWSLSHLRFFDNFFWVSNCDIFLSKPLFDWLKHIIVVNFATGIICLGIHLILKGRNFAFFFWVVWTGWNRRGSWESLFLKWR